MVPALEVALREQSSIYLYTSFFAELPHNYFWEIVDISNGHCGDQLKVLWSFCSSTRGKHKLKKGRVQHGTDISMSIRISVEMHNLLIKMKSMCNSLPSDLDLVTRITF